MRERLRLFLAFSFFWIGIQIFFRAIFLLNNITSASELSFSEIVLVFGHGLKMDLSISGYFLLVTGLILSFSVFNTSRWVLITLNTFTIFMVLVSCCIVVADIELYKHWGFRMNTTPLFYLGSEAVGSVDATVMIKLLSIFATALALIIYTYMKVLAPRIARLSKARKRGFAPLILISALMFLPIRGSFTVAPMNTGFVFFHRTNAFANHAAINVIWNFLYSVQSMNKAYPQNFFDHDLTEKYFTALYPTSDSTFHLFNSTKPNVIIFLVESFTADIIEPLGGMPGVAPNMSRLCTQGVLFDNAYASGDRTDKGIVSVLSGYPAQPLTSIIKYSEKTQKLPYLAKKMQHLGYHTSFVYGGDVDFANMRSYLTNCGFEHMTTEEDFPDEFNYSKWGIHDHLVLEHALKECDTATAPFFKVILTLSSHEPFDVPMSSPFLNPSEEGLFLNACHYTDSAIGTFIEAARQRAWWKNSVILFVADHGHRSPGNKEINDMRRFRIPLLLTGGAVKMDTVIHTFISQTDIANTLLAQLDKPSKEFIFSKNVMGPEAKSFAAYFYNDGYGFVGPGQYIIYDNPGKQFLKKDGASPEDLDISKAYQQKLFIDYNNR